MAPPAAQIVEYDAARTQCAVADLRERQQLRVAGADAGSFLQGMVTNDVEALGVGDSCYAAVLTPKGAMVGDVRILRRENEFIVDTGPGRAAQILAFLQKYLISEEAEIHLAPELALVGLLGPRSEQVALELPQAVVLGRFRSLLGGVDVLVPRDHLDAASTSLSHLPMLSQPTLEVLRVEAGIPLFGIDMTETTIPLEANLERAIAYQKGCYIGQEVIARATYRGQMNKRLMGLLLGDVECEAGVELRRGERKAGWLTSVVSSRARNQVVALGYVHRDFLEPGTQLEVASGGTAVVTGLPFTG